MKYKNSHISVRYPPFVNLFLTEKCRPAGSLLHYWPAAYFCPNPHQDSPSPSLSAGLQTPGKVTTTNRLLRLLVVTYTVVDRGQSKDTLNTWRVDSSGAKRLRVAGLPSLRSGNSAGMSELERDSSPLPIGTVMEKRRGWDLTRAR